jgi:hypothetical protein
MEKCDCGTTKNVKLCDYCHDYVCEDCGKRGADIDAHVCKSCCKTFVEDDIYDI